MARECGPCTLCCKILGVRSLNKPRNVWCRHVSKGAGCDWHGSAAYPEECGQFVCAWLAQDIAEQLRPDKVHAFVTDTTDGKGVAIQLDPGYPLAHLDDPLKAYIAALTARGMPVVVTSGRWIYRSAGRGVWMKAEV